MFSLLMRWRAYFIYCGIFSIFISFLQLTFTFFNMLIFDKVLTSNSIPSLIAISCIATVALITNVLMDLVRNRLLVRLGIQMDIDMSDRVFKNMIQEVSSARGGMDSAHLRDVAMLRNYCSGSAIFTFFDLFMVPLCLGLIFILHPLMGLVATCGGIITFVLGILADKLTRKTLDDANAVSRQAANLSGQATRNAEAVMSMGMMPGIMNKWQGMNNRVMNLQTLASKRAGLLQAVIRGMRTFMQIAVNVVGAYLIVIGEGSAGMMLGSAIAMGKALGPIDAGVSAYSYSLEAFAAYRRLRSLFTQGEEPPRMDMPVPQGNLSCESVIYVAQQGMPLLQGITFQLKAGQSMGLIGPSAAGKSTLCRVLVGLWRPMRGVVRLDGVDIHSYDPDKRGAFIGYLPQDVELFSGTVAENIARLGEVEPEKVIEAAKLAGAHEMILQFPKGYDSEIGAAGAILSGGQRQRIGLARALYGQPRLLVLDEPSSNLDDEGERALAGAMAQMKALGSTVIVVSHKPSTISGVDMLMVLKTGQVALFGPREAALRQLVGGAPAPAAPAAPSAPSGPGGAHTYRPILPV
jgi:PrtD family type I secretion system ABC transporter